MAIAMMEAVADFSKKNQATTVNLVRVVIFQAEMVPTYLDQMDKATKPGSSIMYMITKPFQYIGDAIRGSWIFQSYVLVSLAKFNCLK